MIGGNGSQAGRTTCATGFPVIGVASTIDNDLCGTDFTIGVDTALNIALEAIDRLKVTALSHGRGFLVEVMGRKCGYLASHGRLGRRRGRNCGSGNWIATRSDRRELHGAYARGKSHALVVVAEGSFYNAEKLQRVFREHRERLQFELRVTKLGHVQRGGAPTAFDRILATRLGAGAVDQLIDGKRDVVIGMRGAEITATPLDQIVGKQKPIKAELFHLARSLAK